MFMNIGDILDTHQLPLNSVDMPTIEFLPCIFQTILRFISTAIAFNDEINKALKSFVKFVASISLPRLCQGTAIILGP